MGRQVAREESLKDPKGLSDPNEISKILKKNKGSEAIEGIRLNVLEIEDMRSSSQAFPSVPNQKFLILHENFNDEW
ncbi:hypothetical protein K1719_045858 [Acacia pycnantha]|nr:hypothetical protein K1719_045858 [Acacia pycnantha]